MKNKVIKKVPCPRCRAKGGDTAGDNLVLYSDGSGYCFACQLSPTKYTAELQEEEQQEQDNLPESFTFSFAPTRGLTAKTMEFFGVKAKLDTKGSPVQVFFPFGSYTQVRDVGSKRMHMIGDGEDVSLFGKQCFNAGSAKSITITEGAYDAMSVFEMLGSKYPAVSVRSSVHARRDCEKDHAYLNSFDQIYLCFDGDEPGQRAAKEVASLFDVNKVFHVKLTKFKDANEYLQAGEAKEFANVWWNAKKFMPKGIVSSFSEIEGILKKESAQASASYPFPTLDSLTYGIRLGELVLFTALEKVGKTEVLRAIEYHLLKTTDANVGIIHLEEGEKRSVQGLVSYELGVPCHLPDAGVSAEDQLNSFKALAKGDNRLYLYPHFGSDDPDTILDIIRYLVAVCHCKYIFLDHITMLVTGFEDEDERKKLDYISTRLAMMTRELNFTLFLVSHVNDNGQTRGSRNISKVADLIIHLERDLEAPDAETRNTTSLLCRGNRFAGTTGPCGRLTFDSKSYTVKEQPKPEIEEFTFDVAA